MMFLLKIQVFTLKIEDIFVEKKIQIFEKLVPLKLFFKAIKSYNFCNKPLLS